MRGTLKVSPRLFPIDFFEILGPLRSLVYRRKNLEKFRRESIKSELKPVGFLFAVYRTVFVSSDIWQIRQKNIGGNRIPQPPVRKIFKKYWA